MTADTATMNGAWTPDPDDPSDVARAIVETKNRIARGVRIIADKEKAMDAKATEFARAYAQAYVDAEGSEQLRRRTAELETIPLRKECDETRQAFKHAEHLADSLSKELFAWQSILKHLTAVYGAAGVDQR